MPSNSILVNFSNKHFNSKAEQRPHPSLPGGEGGQTIDLFSTSVITFKSSKLHLDYSIVLSSSVGGGGGGGGFCRTENRMHKSATRLHYVTDGQAQQKFNRPPKSWLHHYYILTFLGSDSFEGVPLRRLPTPDL